MERITIKDLTRKLNELVEPVSEGIETSEVMVLEDTLWGLENGVYRPLGELQLPIQYANGEFPHLKGTCYDLFTLFTHNFFDGFAEKFEDSNRLRYCEDIIDRLPKDKLYIHSGGISSEISAKKLTQDFCSGFFKHYQNLSNVSDEEARECLQRSFVKYE